MILLDHSSPQAGPCATWTEGTWLFGSCSSGWQAGWIFVDGEMAAVKCMEEHTDYLGHGIAGFINTFAPQKVVIGGGISEANFKERSPLVEES